MELNIRKYSQKDFQYLSKIAFSAFEKGDSYPYNSDIGTEKFRKLWCLDVTATYIAEISEEIVGTYYIKPNQEGRGSHVCNVGYIVDENMQNKGIGKKLCSHSQIKALELGFRAMQFNLVVSTNIKAVNLWKHQGFDIIGTIIQAFEHKRLGLVDAYIMHKIL